MAPPVHPSIPASVAAAALAFLGVGCGNGRQAPAEPAPVVVTAAVARPPAAVAAHDGGDELCGCGLCAPRMSDDPCSGDGDCAPSTPCHAPACVARAKAQPRKADTVCTMNLRCDSADANDCACIAGHCGLRPR